MDIAYGVLSNSRGGIDKLTPPDTGNLACGWRIRNLHAKSTSYCFDKKPRFSPTHLTPRTAPRKDQLGSGSKFGFENLLGFFGLLKACSVLPPAKLGIRSVSTTLPFFIRISR
jgi:hypothetical protein